MEKKLKCDCGASIFTNNVRVYLVDLSEAANSALQFLRNQYDRKPVSFPDELLKEISVRRVDVANPHPSLLMLAYKAINAVPVFLEESLEEHSSKCEKCRRYISCFEAETAERKLHPSVRHETSLVILETRGDHLGALDEYSIISCDACGSRYEYSTGSGLRKITN